MENIETTWFWGIFHEEKKTFEDRATAQPEQRLLGGSASRPQGAQWHDKPMVSGYPAYPNFQANYILCVRLSRKWSCTGNGDSEYLNHDCAWWKVDTARFIPNQTENLCCSNSLTLPNADNHHLATFHWKLQHIKSTDVISNFHLRNGSGFSKATLLGGQAEPGEVRHDGFPWPSMAFQLMLHTAPAPA